VSGHAAPPSGIMLGLFSSVKQFLFLLTLFSCEFYIRSKHSKKAAKAAVFEVFTNGS
jgi:hypothetical protein